ncbi:MAG: aminoglycoside 3'-phosphotransferase [uncultured Acidimicrobiales bacterium]|uniref:Aminoglycoside 3'-phosphotransferase n=1 Tax=uncultured Acidimicrobiales bacterium TaxID=310071 RepID=A0A6J4H283_9ACTN|nr:MAG: aminoglycoside 3'-phosphotransferase [uncultured Acidimicrobiales bacterium]
MWGGNLTTVNPLDEPRLHRDADPVLASEPDDAVAVPPVVGAFAAGRPVKAVWRNTLGGLTFEVGVRPDHCFVKWSPRSSGIDLGAEIARLEWAGRFTSVPRIVGHGSDDDASWMISEPLPGDNAVTTRWKADPATAVAAMGEGLRALHEALPVEGCPFDWSLESRLRWTRQAARLGLLDPSRWHEEHQGLGIDGALALLAEPPDLDRVVVCHGDSCAPNTLIGEDGRWCGHVDLGTMGTADRWADLAVASWSTAWNYGPGWEVVLLDAYGIAPDAERTRYYRLLWDLGP